LARPGEFELIERFTRPFTRGEGVRVGIGDDAAVLRLPPGEELVATVDAVVEGVHFTRRFTPEEIGWKALAVNLSDLAAMGARPLWALVALATPPAAYPEAPCCRSPLLPLVTRDVRDCALLLQAIAGHDPLDSTSVDTPVPDYAAGLIPDLKGVRIGLPKEYFITGLDTDVHAAVEAAVATCRALGAEIVEVSLPHTEYAVACYYLIATAEASSNLARYDGVRFGRRAASGGGLIDMFMQSRAAGFGSEVKRRIMLGTYALSSGYYDAYYLKAQKVRTLIRQDFLAAFAQVDVLLTPVAPTPAFGLGEKTADPLQMYLSDIFTIPVNLAGTCALSLPCGVSTHGLPIGLQLIGKPFAEGDLLRAAYAYEQATAWHNQKANI